MGIYHKVNKDDCLSVATKTELTRLNSIWDFALFKTLALRWCDKNGYKLYGYLGNLCWDASSS